MQSWHKLYSRKAWVTLRHLVYIRDLGICQICKKAVSLNHKHRHAFIADHIKAHKGDEELFFDIDNVQCVCKSCHDSVKQSHERGGNAKVKQTIGVDGWPIE